MNYATACKHGFLLILFLLPCLSHSQNIVLNVTGKVLVSGRPVKKGDNLENNVKIVLSDPAAEVKVLSPIGVCVIKYKNCEQKGPSELMELIKSCIRKNSIGTLGTRAWTINPDKNRQVQLVDSLCKTLKVTPDNVEDLFGRYITPYCVLEFEKPYWQDIAQFLQTKYGFDPPHFTGARMTPEQYQAIPLVPKVRSFMPAPAEASLKNYCPTPGNQGRYGTCTAWASAYAARTISWAVRNNLTDVTDITNQAFSPSFIYTQIKNANDFNCQQGVYIDKSVEALKAEGAVFLTDLPYQCDPDISPFFQQAKSYAIKDFQRLTARMGFTTDDDLANIKQALADKKPVIGSILCYQSFMNSKGGSLWEGKLDDFAGYHAVCLVGYDDHFENGDGTMGAVELMNSWGTTWGDGGFIHIKYGDLMKVLYFAVALYDDAQPVPLPEPPQPEPLPPTPPDTMKRMEGSFSLLLSDGSAMPLEGNETVFRNLKLVSVEKMTYTVSNAYPAGTLFRIHFTSSQPAYVYVISTDSKYSSLAQLFPDPDRNISALLDFKSEVSVSIPDETQYIQMDETPGDDYLCVIYSKEELNMDTIKNALQNNPAQGFVNIVKEALADRMMNEDEVVFEKNRIAFQSVSGHHTAVPIFVKIRHS